MCGSFCVCMWGNDVLQTSQNAPICPPYIYPATLALPYPLHELLGGTQGAQRRLCLPAWPENAHSCTSWWKRIHIA